MSDEAEAKAEAAGIDDDHGAIRARILAEPGIVLDDMAVMQALVQAHDRHRDRGGAGARRIVDLRGVLIERLESQLGELEETHREVISAAYENIAGANQIHRAVLAVLAPTRFSDVLDVLAGEAPRMLSVERLRLCLETRETPGEALDAVIAGSVIEPLPPGGVAAYMRIGRDQAHRDVVLRRHAAGDNSVFGADAAEIGSEALVRLDFGKSAPPGLLVFGAADPDRFGPDQGGDLLAFFGGVVARSIRRWVA